MGDLIHRWAEGNPNEGKERMTASEVEMVVKSLQDHMAFKKDFVRPCERMLEFMEEYFPPRDPGNGSAHLKLDIRSGSQGSCLSHSHSQQYLFVSQSLTLWKNIMAEFSELYHAAENDMLESTYRLCDTGQGSQGAD